MTSEKKQKSFDEIIPKEISDFFSQEIPGEGDIEREIRIGVPSSNFNPNIGKTFFKRYYNFVKKSDGFELKYTNLKSKVESSNQIRKITSEDGKVIYQKKIKQRPKDIEVSPYYNIRLSNARELESDKNNWVESLDIVTRQRTRNVFICSHFPGVEFHFTVVETLKADSTLTETTFEVEIEIPTQDKSKEESMSKLWNFLFEAHYFTFSSFDSLNLLYSKEFSIRILNHLAFIEPNKIRDLSPDNLSSELKIINGSSPEYLFSYKLDGNRYFIYFFNEFIVLINPSIIKNVQREGKSHLAFENNNFLIFKSERKFIGQTLCEGELKNNEIKLFDCMIFQGKHITNNKTIDRQANIETVISWIPNGIESRYKKSVIKVTRKEFFSGLSAFDRMIQTIKLMWKMFLVVEKIEENTDGLVTIPNSHYSDEKAYKIKYTQRLSIDFLPRIISSDEKQLRISLFSGGKGVNVPFLYESNFIKITENTTFLVDKSGISSEINGKNIIEFYWDYSKKTFYPKLVRWDKPFPNNINVAKAIMKNIEHPIYLKDIAVGLLRMIKTTSDEDLKSREEDLKLIDPIDSYTRKKMGILKEAWNPPFDYIEEEKTETKSVATTSVATTSVATTRATIGTATMSGTTVNGIQYQTTKKIEVKSNKNELFRKFQNQKKQELISLIFSDRKEGPQDIGGDRLFNILEMGFGPGGDTDKYFQYKSKFDKLFAVEPNMDHIEQMKERFKKHWNKDYNFQTYIRQVENNVSMNGFLDYKNIINGTSNIKYVGAMFSLTFLFKDLETINSFVEILNKTVMVGGYFYGTYMDGDLVEKMLSKTDMDGEYKIGDVAQIIKKYNDLTREEIKTKYNERMNLKTKINKKKITTKTYTTKDKSFEDRQANYFIGDLIKISMDLVSITTQDEYLVRFKFLEDKLREIGFVKRKNEVFSIGNYQGLTKEEIFFITLNKSFIFYRQQDASLKLKMLTSTSPRYHPFTNFITEDVQLVRTFASGYGSCFIDSVLTSIMQKYRDEDDLNNKKEIITNFRSAIASEFKNDRNAYTNLSNGTGYMIELQSGVYNTIESSKISRDEKDNLSKFIHLEFKKIISGEISIKQAEENLQKFKKDARIKIDLSITEILERGRKKFVDSLEDVTAWVDDTMMKFISSVIGYGIIIITDDYRYATKAIKSSKKPEYIVMINIGNQHYESVSEAITLTGSDEIYYNSIFNENSVLIKSIEKMGLSFV